jgi:hypothetical protein
MASAKQLVMAMAAVDRGGWSAADLRQLHTEGLPAARRLAPLVGVQPIASSEVKATDRMFLAVKVVGCLIWVNKGMKEEHFTEEALIQPACELLCALSDVFHALLIVDESEPSSSSGTQPVRSTAFSRFLQLKQAASEARQLGSTCTGFA